MMPLSDPEVFGSSENIIFGLAFGGVLAVVGFGGTFGLRAIYKKIPRFCKVIVGIMYTIIICTGILSVVVGFDSNVGFESAPNTPFLAASVIFGIVVFFLGIVLLLNLLSKRNLEWVTKSKPGAFIPALEKVPRLYLVAAIISLAIGVVVGLTVSNAMKQEYLSKAKILNEGSRINAVVIEKKIWSDSEGYNSHTVKYTFSSTGGELFTGTETMEKKVYDNLKVGSSIEIAFNPVEPSQNFPLNGAEKNSPGLAILMAAVFSAVASFIVLFFFFRWLYKRIS